MTSVASDLIDASAGTAVIETAVDALALDASDLLISYVVGSKVRFIKYQL